MLTGLLLPVCFVSLHACVEPLALAGIGKLSTADGKAFADPEVLRRLTSSVSCALDEAAAALTRMRAENTLNAGQPDKYGSPELWLYIPQLQSSSPPCVHTLGSQQKHILGLGCSIFGCVPSGESSLKSIGLNCSFIKSFNPSYVNKDFIYLYTLESH